jgi:hypothetical protein
MTDPRKDVEAVRAALRRFQEGYARRDLRALDRYMALFDQGAGLEVIGTGGVFPGEGEWCVGPEMVRDLVRDDWQNWGDLDLDVDDATIQVLDDVAWLAALGTVSDEDAPGQTWNDSLRRLQSLLASDVADQDKVLAAAREATETLFEASRGRVYIWPIRFTAVLVREEGQWTFKQAHFSFPTARLPDVRYTDSSDEGAGAGRT